MLNKYVWNNYLKSGGSDVVEMFNRFICGHTENYALGIRQLVSRFCPMELELNRLQDDLEDLFIDVYDIACQRGQLRMACLFRWVHRSVLMVLSLRIYCETD